MLIGLFIGIASILFQMHNFYVSEYFMLAPLFMVETLFKNIVIDDQYDIKVNIVIIGYYLFLPSAYLIFYYAIASFSKNFKLKGLASLIFILIIHSVLSWNGELVIKKSFSSFYRYQLMIKEGDDKTE